MQQATRARQLGLPVRALQRCWQSKEAGDATSGSQVARSRPVKGQKEVGLLSKMRAKLAGSQFRWLNEQLYTCPGSQAFELMQEQPQLFQQYHEVQMSHHIPLLSCEWQIEDFESASMYPQHLGATVNNLYDAHTPGRKSTDSSAGVSPTLCCIDRLARRAQDLFLFYCRASSSRQPSGPCSQYRQLQRIWPSTARKAVVADFGCGDAELARMAPQETVHSLDLVSSAPGVIACNMADTPLGTCPIFTTIVPTAALL